MVGRGQNKKGNKNTENRVPRLLLPRAAGALRGASAGPGSVGLPGAPPPSSPRPAHTLPLPRCHTRSSSRDATRTHWAQGSEGQPARRWRPGSLTFILTALEPARCPGRWLSFGSAGSQGGHHPVGKCVSEPEHQRKCTRREFATARQSQGERETDGTRGSSASGHGRG